MSSTEISQAFNQLEKAFNRAAKNTVNKTVNIAMRYTKKKTNVHKGAYPDGRLGGTLKKSWEMTPAHKEGNVWRGDYHNNIFYGPYVNWGHRIVRNGKTVGRARGFFFLEAGIESLKHYHSTTAGGQAGIFYDELQKERRKGGW